MDLLQKRIEINTKILEKMNEQLRELNEVNSLKDIDSKIEYMLEHNKKKLEGK